MNQVAVIGGGAMGTAMAVLFAKAVGEVRLWVRRPDRAGSIASLRENRDHLPGIALDDSIRPTSDVGEALDGADLAVVAIPSAFLRATVGPMAGSFRPGLPILSVVKGIEIGTGMVPTAILAEVLGTRGLAILTGPSHAEEIAAGLPASVVVAANDPDLAIEAQRALNSETFRVYTNPDLIGAELAGALKNVLGVAAGICEGLGFGDNAKAALLTRGLVEITRLGVRLGADPSTFAGLAGLGDVITTCYSKFGRNRDLGIKIGQGSTLETVRAGSKGVAEGAYTARSVSELAARLEVSMPITDEVCRILYDGKPPRLAFEDLMLRPPRDERP